MNSTEGMLGATFPTAIKWQSQNLNPGTEKYLKSV